MSMTAPAVFAASISVSIRHHDSRFRACPHFAALGALTPPVLATWVASFQRTLPGSSGSAFSSGLDPELP